MLWGFIAHNGQKCEMSPKSLWNDKFDQVLADFAGNVFGRKIAAR